MKFVHESNNINCDKIIEFDYLKRFEQRAGRTIKLRKSDSTHGFLLHINIGLKCWFKWWYHKSRSKIRHSITLTEYKDLHDTFT